VSELQKSLGVVGSLTQGIRCDETGVFVGETPLLENSAVRGQRHWRPRLLCDLNNDLTASYAALPIEFGRKMAGLETIARALNGGDLARAQIATLHLQLPDPPNLTKSAPTTSAVWELARRLLFADLLKAGWDPAKHPRWPAQSTDGVGGQFAPAGGSDDAAGARNSDPGAELVPAQYPIAVPMPFPEEIPAPLIRPFPSDIVPPVVITPRDTPRNPYPNRPECVEEWAQAQRYCKELLKKGQLGKGDYRNMGKLYYQCLMGQVSEDCGGNPVI